MDELLKIFEGVELSDEAKTKISELFEAKVEAKSKELAAENASTLTEAVTQAEANAEIKITEGIAAEKEIMLTKMDSFLTQTIKEWATANQIAIESGTKVSIAEKLIAGVTTTLSENNITLSDEDSAIVTDLQEEVTTLKDSINESKAKLLRLGEENERFQRSLIISDVCESLTDSQVEKVADLSEGIEYKSSEDFTRKVTILKETYCPKAVDENDDQNKIEEGKKVPAKSNTLTESVLAQFK